MKNKNARGLLLTPNSERPTPNSERPTPNSERPTPNFILAELLSIDADAHLEKLAANMFPSPALLPVELVRTALKRKANAVSIQVRAERIVISDNGDAIGSAEWQALACLGDSGQSAAAREKAIALIQDLAHPGIGLLAVFLPGVRSLKIETAGSSGSSTLRMDAGRIGLQNGSSWPRGTRISIQRRRGPAEEEKVLIAQLCGAVLADITLNGRPLEKRPLLSRNLAAMNVAPAGDPERSLLAIPVQGDVCRVWLLEQGIPWQVSTMAPVHGLVFNAALESVSQLAAPELETLAASASRLYRWLADNYAEFPEHYQSRIEDLFFKQARAEGDPGLLSVCAPFRVWPSRQRITLADVRRLAANGILYAADADGYAGPGGRLPENTLFLTPPQKDFLIHHMRLPIVVLNREQEIKVRPRKLLAYCRAKFSGWQRWSRPSAARIVDRSRLSPQENDFCRALEERWSEKIARVTPEDSSLPRSVAMVEGRGLFPARRLKKAGGEMLLIRRRHPQTRRSLQRFAQDRDNSEMAFAALMPNGFLTDGR